MKPVVRLTILILLALSASAVLMQANKKDAASSRVDQARLRAVGKLEPLLEKKGLRLGDEVFMRIFKESNELEVFLLSAKTKKFLLLKKYPICKFSGALGPKQKQGDRQAPEGFYFVARKAMNPASRYHLAFNLGYPNAYDRAHKRTGDYLMVHGNCVSIGCYAMTDPLIEEIYTVADAALANGQKYFRVHCFPFRMTGARMAKAKKDKSPWLSFWENLQDGYDFFERDGLPPEASVKGKLYQFSSGQK